MLLYSFSAVNLPLSLGFDNLTRNPSPMERTLIVAFSPIERSNLPSTCLLGNGNSDIAFILSLQGREFSGMISFLSFRWKERMLLRGRYHNSNSKDSYLSMYMIYRLVKSYCARFSCNHRSFLHPSRDCKTRKLASDYQLL